MLFGEVYNLTHLIQSNIESTNHSNSRKISPPANHRRRNRYHLLVRHQHAIASDQSQHWHRLNWVLLSKWRVPAAQSTKRDQMVEGYEQHNRKTNKEKPKNTNIEHANRPHNLPHSPHIVDNHLNPNPLPKAQQARTQLYLEKARPSPRHVENALIERGRGWRLRVRETWRYQKLMVHPHYPSILQWWLNFRVIRDWKIGDLDVYWYLWYLNC
jgi:hypothetical protein